MRAQLVHVVRLGFIKVSVYLKQTEQGERHVVTIVRLYKDGDRWCQSARFYRNDLPLVAKAVDLAHSWIYNWGEAELRPAKQGDSRDDA